MPAVNLLPEGYTPILSVDLQKNKKLAFWLNFSAFLVALALVLPVCFVVPITTLFDAENLPMMFLRVAMIAIGSIVYIVLHEVVHGIAMKMCGTKKIKYGFTGLYAFAGSEDCYTKGAYIFIALAPVVLFGVLLAVLCLVLPTSWFWVVYIIQITNLSGAAGDAYVTVRFARLPADILIKDNGTSMTVYSRSTETE